MKWKRLMVEVDVDQWALLRAQAAEEGRFVRVVLDAAIRRYLEEPGGSGVSRRVVEVPAVVEGRGSGQRLTLDQLRASGVVKTGRQLLEEREGRRGDESGSQIRDDEDLPGVRAWEE